MLLKKSGALENSRKPCTVVQFQTEQYNLDLCMVEAKNPGHGGEVGAIEQIKLMDIQFYLITNIIFSFFILS